MSWLEEEINKVHLYDPDMNEVLSWKNTGQRPDLQNISGVNETLELCGFVWRWKKNIWKLRWEYTNGKTQFL